MFEEALLTIQRGGIIMIPLILCSIIALAIIIEKMITLKRKKIIMSNDK